MKRKGGWMEEWAFFRPSNPPFFQLVASTPCGASTFENLITDGIKRICLFFFCFLFFIPLLKLLFIAPFRRQE